MSKATPRPWVAQPEESDKPYIRIRGTRLGERYKIVNVLTPVLHGEDPREADETRANAALIVRAVNSFDELVAACEALIADVVSQAATGDCGQFDPEKVPAVIQARAALQKARTP